MLNGNKTKLKKPKTTPIENVRLNKKDTYKITCKCLIVNVGMTGFEPATSCTPCKYATELRYIPNS